MLKFTSIVGHTSCGPTYIESFLAIFGQCINVLNYKYIYIPNIYFLIFLPETRRPPWLDPDPKPADLENARKALFYEHNPNQPHSPDQQRAVRLGLSSRPLHRRSRTAPAHMRVEKLSVDKVRT